MQKTLLILFLGFSLLGFSQQKETLKLKGLKEPVEVLRDKWGVNHIYANNEYDLFFAQGYCAVKDRLFQFEVWRRQATGTVSEILGKKELKRDIGTRLFKFRGNLEDELNHYHNNGSNIIKAYVDGVNAYINEINKTPDSLPIEFKILNIKPKTWTEEVVISRHQGLKSNVTRELNYGILVHKLGEKKVKELSYFHPNDPKITLDSTINGALLNEEILALYNAFASRVSFDAKDIAHKYLGPSVTSKGSNNWVVSGKKTTSGFPYMINDPHRRIAVPSLRYMVHLVGPNWNVLGGGEPEIPGVSIGHNEYGAWGLTIFLTDSEDLYVYDLNPKNLTEYSYKNQWVKMDEIEEKIPVKDADSVAVTLRFTKHGPVTYIDSVNNKAYAVRAAWMKKGGAPYLASLRMNQSKNWEEFREACSYSNLPAENMIWADKQGNIGWQVVGIKPLRKNFSGLVPVSGDGRYEWEGFQPIKERPNLYNPKEEFFATANQHVTPKDYKYNNLLGYNWSDPYRGDRINEVLLQNKKFSLKDMANLQSDYYSIPARNMVKLLKGLTFKSEKVTVLRDRLLKWNYVLDPNSIEAAIYNMWEHMMMQEAKKQLVPNDVSDLVYIQLSKIDAWLNDDKKTFGTYDIQINKKEFLTKTFELAIAEMNKKLGSDIERWQYGQTAYKHSYLKNPFTDYITKKLNSKLNVGPLPRGGNSYTPNSTGALDNQSSGGSFKILVDVSDWDKALMINTPGQSGNVESPFYKNLFELWAKNEYFPAYFSKEKIKDVTAEKTVLLPVTK